MGNRSSRLARNHYLCTLETVDIDDSRGPDVVRLNRKWMRRRCLRECLSCRPSGHQLPLDNVFGGLIEAFRPSFVESEETRLLTMGRLLLRAYNLKCRRQNDTTSPLQKLNYMHRLAELQDMHAAFHRTVKSQYEAYDML